MRVIGRELEPQTASWREQIQALLDALDAARRPPVREGRRSIRVPYRSLNLVVHVLNDRGKPANRLQVTSRNISTCGLAFLYRQMMPVGVKLHIEIPMIDDRRLEVLARVTRCRHIKGMMHEIGVEFLSAEDRPAGQHEPKPG